MREGARAQALAADATPGDLAAIDETAAAHEQLLDKLVDELVSSIGLPPKKPNKKQRPALVCPAGQ